MSRQARSARHRLLGREDQEGDRGQELRGQGRLRRPDPQVRRRASRRTSRPGLGPLHSVFDDKGNGYTSHFLDSTVVKWTLGPPYNPPDKAWKVVDKVSVHYNIGHLQAPGSNTKKPCGKYLVALNKWSVDRFPPLGPLHPQNLQLIDISGEKMKLLSDTPTIGEPHNSQIIPVELLQAWTTYPEIGFDPVDDEALRVRDRAGQGGDQARRQHGDRQRHACVRSHYTPDIVRVKEGDKVVFNWTNVESARDATHGFGLHGYNVNLSIDPGATERAEIVASKAGRLSVLLHRVLLGAAHGDDRLAAGRAEGAVDIRTTSAEGTVSAEPGPRHRLGREPAPSPWWRVARARRWRWCPAVVGR